VGYFIRFRRTVIPDRKPLRVRQAKTVGVLFLALREGHQQVRVLGRKEECYQDSQTSFIKLSTRAVSAETITAVGRVKKEEERTSVSEDR